MNRGFACIGLDNPKNRINVGSVLRAAGCFGASMVAVSGPRPQRYVGRIASDTQAAYRHMPLMSCADLHEILPYDCVPIAVDLCPGARPLSEYIHPERAMYIFGAEDATLGRRVTDWCRDVVYIPTTNCLNLAMAVNIVLYDRACKRGFPGNAKVEAA